MKHICFAIACLLHTAGALGQAANPTYSTYTGQAELIGTQSVRLLPGFHAAQGSTLRVFITDVTTLGNGASSNRNYIQTTRYLSPSTITRVEPTSAQAMRDIVYFDGLGRPLQEVQVKASGGGGFRDLVTPVAYDGYGRQEYQYLPYATDAGAGGAFKAGAVTAQGSYYSSTTTVPAGQTAHAHPRSRTVFEPSPLNRVTEQGFPGATWQPGSRTATGGRTVMMAQATNDAGSFGLSGRRVARYGATINATTFARTLTLDGIYAAGELYVTYTRDENWTSTDGRNGSVEEYTDKLGRVVLKRTYTGGEAQSTYYVYDDFGLLAFVLTPGRDAEFNPDTGTLPTQARLDQFAYQYRYDARGRLVEKRIPGKEWEYLVYNGLDQVVGTQDANQRAKSPQEWTVTKYDGLKRVVLTGLWYHSVAANTNSRATVQGLVNAITGTNQWEDRNTAGTAYTSRSWPTTGISTTLTEHYYDDYNIAGLPATYKPVGYSAMTHGLPTATRTKVLGAGTSTSNMLWDVSHYDDKGKVVRQYRQHYQGGGTVSTYDYDEISNVYSFTGQVTKSTRKHHIANTGNTAVVLQLTVVTEYDYDHRERLTDTWKTVTPLVGTAAARTLIARNVYNELGQVRAKELHKENATATAKQTVTYSYNERGWMRTANASLFSLELRYNAGAAQFNGNISSQHWTTQGQGAKTYTYSYDKLDRLTDGVGSNAAHSETGIIYDRSGNIRSLKRGNAAAQAYVYTDWGNRLKSVTGGISRTYTYDRNGNVENDGTNTFTYNTVNLPATVTGPNAATYTYDATGRKLRRVKGGVATEYIDGIQYSGTGIDFVQTEVGRVYNSGGSYRYEYTLTDHLGNARVSFDINGGSARMIQSDDYHPFGLVIGMYVSGVKNNYLYNGKELQDGIGQYDYGARFYDPVIGRWGSVDPLAENDRGWSPYNYARNNPVRFIDPDGMEWADPERDQKIADRLQKGIQNRLSSENRNLQSANNAVAKLESKIAEGGSTQKLENKLSDAKNKVTSINERIGDLNSSSAELTLMGSSEVSQKFTFNELVEGSPLGFAYVKDGIITMDIVSDANAIHEAVHGYQIYTTGGIKQSERLDVEVPAYQRQFSFDTPSVTGLTSDWGRLKGRNDINKNWVMGLRDGNGNYPYMPSYDRKSMRALIERIKKQ